ncbi:MAG: restriction endonuclease [Lachnospiraceae bacterium]|nr:restriction endonuclease [Lachnospiraceae bacterium]
MGTKRTFGWVQNPGDISKLKRVVSVFSKGSKTNEWLVSSRLPLLLDYKLISKEDYNLFLNELKKSKIEIEYSLLKGKGAGSAGRKDAICTGIVQAVIDGQQNRTYIDDIGDRIEMKKPYTDDWTAEGFLRWAISCGYIDYDTKSDRCKITELGLKLANSIDTSDDEREAFAYGLLSYPPVIRVLSLLKEKDNQTKFELGNKLGFKGELGFTSIPQDVYLCDYDEAKNSKEKSEVRSNEEGDADKYARGIASWCMQMGWITAMPKTIEGTYRGKKFVGTIQAYSITRLGEKALIVAKGNSSNKRLDKIVHFEMLASNKAYGADYLRYERATIIKSIEGNYKSLEQIKNSLVGYELDIDVSTIKDHINGLINIGLDVAEKEGKYKLLDNVIKLEIPSKNSYTKDEVNVIVDRVRPKLKNIDHKYLELISLAYSDASTKGKKNIDAREFEIKTADLFINELGFDGMRLGDANRPDVIISKDNKGTIIDNKSYKDGFNINKHSADEMSRYINENVRRDKTLNSNCWWLNFNSNVKDFTFLFITSYLKGEFKKQLEYISKANNGIMGAAIGIENLLYISECIKSRKVTHVDFYSRFKNNEITFEI